MIRDMPTAEKQCGYAALHGATKHNLVTSYFLNHVVANLTSTTTIVCIFYIINVVSERIG